MDFHLDPKERLLRALPGILFASLGAGDIHAGLRWYPFSGALIHPDGTQTERETYLVTSDRELYQVFQDEAGGARAVSTTGKTLHVASLSAPNFRTWSVNPEFPAIHFISHSRLACTTF